MNAIPYYVGQEYWEISAFRGNEWTFAEEFLSKIKQKHIAVDDSVGMFCARKDFLAFNEVIQLCEKGAVLNYASNLFIQKEFQKIDEIGVTAIFETLMAIYEDTKEIKYLPCTLLKKKYLRNHKMMK